MYRFFTDQTPIVTLSSFEIHYSSITSKSQDPFSLDKDTIAIPIPITAIVKPTALIELIGELLPIR